MNRSSSRSWSLAFFFVAALAFPLAVTAATLDFQVLLDVDNNAATGCIVAGMNGVDQVVVATVTTTETTGTVSSMGRRVCSSGTLGALISDVSGYGAGFNPNSGQMVVESRIAYSALGSGPFLMRIGFAGQTGTSSNSILTKNNGQPILFPEASQGRRRASTPGNLEERIIVLDGETQDWGSIGPLASGNASGQQAFRLSQVRGYGDGQHFFFRIDANLSKNPPPTAVDDAYSVRQGQALVVPAPGVLTNDTDPSGLPLTAQVVTNPTHGVLSFNSNGAFTYVNDGAFVASDFFEYRASNGSADSNTARVVITIIPNGIPQVANDSYSVAHRGTLNVTPPGVLTNDSDPDGDPLSAILLSNPTNGGLTFNTSGGFTYTHNGSNTLSDSFQYAASDTFSQSNPAQVNITVAADIAPTAVADAYTVAEGGTLNQTAPGLFANDSDPDTPQSLWTAQVVTPPVNGILTMGTGGAFTYVHNGSETTTDSFVYRVNDGIANSGNATVTITITPVNDPPVAVNDAYNTNEDTPLTIVAPGLLTNDTDAEGQAMTATRVANATNGNAVVNANGSFTYTPNANFNGTDTFTYTATDASLAVSNTATVTIIVAVVNDVPVFTAGPTVTVNEDSGAYSASWATGVGAGGGADEAGQVLTFNVSNNNNGLFSAQPAIAANGTLTFTPALNANGSATITVSLSDNGSNVPPNVNTSATVNFTINVTAVNDVPVFTKGADQTVNEDAGAQTVNPWATGISAGPADEAGQTLTFNTSNNNNALFSVQPNVSSAGVLSYTPAADAFGSATVTISLSDNGGIANGGVDTSANQTFTITVNAVNDAPVVATSAGTTAFVEDSPAVVVDGALTVTDVDSPTLVSATVTITNLLDAGQETLAATVGATGITANYVAPTLTLTGSSSLANYQTVLRTITYNNASNTPNTTNRVVSFQVNDGAGVNNLSNIANKTVSVAATNDAPVVTTSGGTTAFTEDGGAVVVDGAVTVTDADHANLASATVTITNLADAGAELLAAPTLLGGVTANYIAPTLTLTGSATVADYQTMLRAVTYNNTSQNPTTTARTLAFAATDGTTGSAVSNKTVSVAAVNDAPVVTTTGGTTAFTEDAGAVVVDNGVTVTDVDSTNLVSATVTITNLLDAGVETLAAPTLLGGVTANYAAPTLTLTGSASLADYQTMLQAVTYNNASNNPTTTNRTVRFQANDGAGVNNLSNQADKTVSVAGTNDAPVVTASGGTTAFTEDGAAVVVDGGVTVSDVDNTNLASATVTITNLLDAGVEALAAPTLLGGVTANYVAPTLTLTGSATLADYQTMLRAVTYNNTSQNPTTTNRTLAFVVNDGATNSAASNKTVSITAVNDAPVVTASGGTTAFVEDAGAVAVDGAITVTDIDSTNLAGATVTITNLLDAGVETLAAPTLLGAATASYVAPTLTISGAATVAEYQTMLRAVTYNNASNSPNTTNRVIGFQVDDGAGVNNLSNVSNKTLSVAAMNDAPVVTASGGTTAFTEDGGAVVVDNGVTVSDVDNANLASATVTITNLLDAGAEFLAAPTLLGGATANYVAPTLTISGTTTLANYQTMLQAVTYSNTSNNPTTTNRTLAFVVNDGTTNSTASNKTVSITAVNDAPVVTASGGTTAFVEDAGAVAVDGAITVTDIDSTNLASATVTITNLLDAGVETLSAPTLLGAATANYAAPTLTITGAATVAEYQTMLRAVTYNNASNNPNTTNRTINFQVDDGAGVNNLSNVSAKTLSVAATNDAPVVTASGGTTAFTEDGGAVVVDNGVTVTDVDNANIASATVTITNLLDAGAEFLAAPTLLGGATANYVAPTLTITGSTTLANYQAMLQAVTYNNTSQNPTTTNRILAFAAHDGTNNSAASNKTVSIAAVNDAPVVTASGGTTAFVEDGPAVAVDGAITVTDIDSANLASATVTISNLIDAGMETLAAPTLLGAATANYVAPTLTITGAATVAQYQTMLRAVTYTNASNTPNPTNRIVDFQVNDGGTPNNLSNVSGKAVSVAATNDAPVVTTSGGTVTFTEAGGAIVIDNGVTVTDVDSATIASATITITNLLDAGMETLAAPTLLGGATANYVAPTLTISGTTTLANYQSMLQAVTYNNASTAPNPTNRTIGFQVNDGAGVNNLSNTATRGVVIVSVNSQPVITTSGGTTAFVEDGPAVAIDGALTVTDPDTTTLDSATVTISNLLDAGLETLNAPTLLGGATANYVAPTLTITGNTTLANYETMLRAVTYNNASNTPNTTNRTINFQVNDGQGTNNLSNVASKTVSVAPNNDAPVVTTSGGTTAFTEGGGAVTVDSGVTVSDVDSAMIASATVTISNLLNAGLETLAAPTLLGGATANYVAPTLTITGATTIANYQAMLAAVTYNNSSNNPNTTTRTINFQVNDGAANSNVAGKSVSVTSVNSAPVVTTSGGTTAFVEDAAAVAIDGALTVTDADSANLTQATITITNLLDAGMETLSAPTLLGGATANYIAPTLTISGSTTVANYETMLRAVTYNNSSNTPNTTNRVIAFQVTDGTDASNTANKTVSVAATNDAPIVTTTGGNTAFTEDGGAVTIDSGVTVTDVDSANLASATVTITNLLDAGVETLAAPTLLGGATANYVAPTLTITGSTTLANYQTMLAAVTYNNTSQNPNTTSRVIAFVANDGTNSSTAANKTVTVAGVNDAPVVTTSGGTTAFAEDGGGVAIDTGLTVIDVDSTNLTQATITITNILNAGVELLAAPTLLGGATANYVAPTLTISGSTTVANYQTMLRAVTYNNTSQQPNETTRVINFQVNDGGGVNNLSNTASKNVSVTAVNDAPTPNAVGPFNAQAGITVNFAAATLGGTDVETGTTVTVNTTPGTVTNGSVVLNADGSFSFTPTPGSAGGTASFQYNVCDNGTPGGGTCSSSPATVTLNVAGPAIYFVTAAGAGTTCSQPAPCTLATAVAQIGANTNRKIFIMDNGTHNAAVPLNVSGWLIGQGVTTGFADFDAVFSINPAAVSPGTLATRPLINQARPTVQQTVSLNATTAVRGLNITTTTVVAMNDVQVGTFATPVVNDTNLTATGFAALDLSTITAASLTFGSVNGNGGANSILLNSVAGAITVNGGTLQNTTASAVSITSSASLTTTLSSVTFNNTCVIGITGSTFGTLSVSGVTLNSGSQALSLTTGAVSGTFNSVSSSGTGNATPVLFSGVTGSLTVNAGTVTDADTANTVMSVVGGTANLTWGATLTQGLAAPVVSVSGTNTGVINFNGNVSGSADGADMQFSDADGTYNVNGAGNNFTNGAAININTGSSGNFSFSTGTSVTSGVAGTNNACLTVDSSNPASFTFSGSLSKTAAVTGRLIDLNTIANTAGTFTFQTGTLSTTSTAVGSTGILLNNVDNTVNFNGTTTLNGAGANSGVDITGGSIGAITFNSSTQIGNVSSASGIAFEIDNGSAQTTVTYNGTINTTLNRPVSVQNVGANSVISFTGNVTSTGNGIQLLTMGNPTSVTFSGASKSLSIGANTAVTYTGVAGNTVTFSNGGLAISRTTGAGINATGAGTLIVTRNAGTANTIGNTNSSAAGNGTALSVNGVTIGTGGLVFESISQNGGANGIFLQNTGSTAGLTVAGNSVGNCGGKADTNTGDVRLWSTVAPVTADCTGGTIQNTTGTDNTTGGSGIYLNNTQKVSLTRVKLNDHSNYAIQITTVTGFTADNLYITGTNGTTGTFDEGGIWVSNLAGTTGASTNASIANSTIEGAFEHNFWMVNDTAVLNRITFDNVTVGANANATGDKGIAVEVTGTSATSVTVDNCRFTSARGDMFNLTVQGTGGNADLIIDNSEFNNVHGNIVSGGGGVLVNVGNSGDLTYLITNNLFRGAKGVGLGVQKLFGGGAGNGTASGTINNNHIGVAGVANSGSSEGSGILITVLGRGSHTSLITNNQIRQYTNYGIFLLAGGSSTATTGLPAHDALYHVTIQGNNIAEATNTTGTNWDGIHLRGGTNSPDAYVMCVDIGHDTDASKRNTVDLSAGSFAGSFDIQLIPRFSGTIRLPNFPGTPTDDAGVVTYMQNRNNNSAGTSVAALSLNTAGWTGGAACNQP